MMDSRSLEIPVRLSSPRPSSPEDDSPSAGGVTVDTDVGVVMPGVDPEPGGSEANWISVSSHRADISPVGDGIYSPEEIECQITVKIGPETYSFFQKYNNDPEHKALQDDDKEGEEDEEEEGAVSLEDFLHRCVYNILATLADLSVDYCREKSCVGSSDGVESHLGGQGDVAVPRGDEDELVNRQESVLMDVSDQEDGYQCEICNDTEESVSNLMIHFCPPAGCVRYEHQKCNARTLKFMIADFMSKIDLFTMCRACKMTKLPQLKTGIDGELWELVAHMERYKQRNLYSILAKFEDEDIGGDEDKDDLKKECFTY